MEKTQKYLCDDCEEQCEYAYEDGNEIEEQEGGKAQRCMLERVANADRW